MRVIAGAHKGRRLTAPPGRTTRPTSDRVREALFSILGARVPDARVLDLFAGSGALGIEALSRGAGAVTFVDNDPAAVRVIRANLSGIGEAQVLRRDAHRALRSARENGCQYDLVFLDPPYRHAETLGRTLGDAIAAVLAPDGLAVSESARRSPLDLPPLLIDDERRYGDTLIRLHVH